MSDLPPSISGPLACGLRDVVLEIVGADQVQAALARVPPSLREQYTLATAVEWVPIETMETVFTEIARGVGTSVGELHERVARQSIERTMKTFWRMLLRLTTDRALISRTPVLFGKSYNRGRLTSEIPEPNVAEITLSEWPNAPPWPLRATRIGIETVLGLAGRKNARVNCTPTSDGARYRATWE
jgi:hypothetical protein